MKRQTVNIFWFRRDLRLHDNAGLYHALRNNIPLVPIFIFDRNILDQLEDKKDRRVEFIWEAIKKLQDQLAETGTSLTVFYGFPEEVFKSLMNQYSIESVLANHDYEPYAMERDSGIARLLRSYNVGFRSYKDHVIFEKNEVLKDDGKPYTVFTPYSKKWRVILNDYYLESFQVEKYFNNFLKLAPQAIPGLESLGFEKTDAGFPEERINKTVIKKYKEQRDYPAVNETTRLGIHLRFGTISIRELARAACSLSETFLNELIWRDFYHMILWHFPHVGKGKAFKAEYDKIEWRNDESEFTKWCEGKTGYPIVDAGMRELNETGYMHNRVRMITASFLTKHLLIDWRWGEAYFANKLLDFDLAANNGGWQWAAGSGCDAAPYFRIFNPYLQTKKFDPGLKYVRRWVPEFEELTYPKPIVDHEFARKRCLSVYSKALR